jgi:hypothetical protein
MNHPKPRARRLCERTAQLGEQGLLAHARKKSDATQGRVDRMTAMVNRSSCMRHAGYASLSALSRLGKGKRELPPGLKRAHVRLRFYKT